MITNIVRHNTQLFSTGTVQDRTNQYLYNSGSVEITEIADSYIEGKINIKQFSYRENALWFVIITQLPK